MKKRAGSPELAWEKVMSRGMNAEMMDLERGKLPLDL